MLVQPMTSIAGYITYLKFQAGVDKGTVKGGDNADLFNSVYGLGVMTEGRMQYTSAVINESHTVDAADKAALKLNLDWFPVLSVTSLKVDGHDYSIVAAESEEAGKSASLDEKTGTLTFKTGDTNFNTGKQVNILYSYNNVTIPQNSIPDSLPTLKAHMAHIDLHAHARRIAIYYSQIANFQAKTDYNMDLGEQLAQQAQGELAYEIDSEAVNMLFKGAEPNDELKFVRYADDKAISRSQYYEAFSEIIARAKAIIYTRTQKFAPNYMVVAADVLTIMPYLKGWTAAPAAVVNGPYFAGTVDSMKVFVSPMLARGKFFFGVNGSDLQTAAAVYAPYMAIIPTQLLGFADGGMSQGFSTMYDMKLLSTYNGTAANPEEPKEGEQGTYSWLLVSGELADVTTANETQLNVGTKVRS